MGPGRGGNRGPTEGRGRGRGRGGGGGRGRGRGRERGYGGGRAFQRGAAQKHTSRPETTGPPAGRGRALIKPAWMTSKDAAPSTKPEPIGNAPSTTNNDGKVSNYDQTQTIGRKRSFHDDRNRDIGHDHNRNHNRNYNQNNKREYGNDRSRFDDRRTSDQQKSAYRPANGQRSMNEAEPRNEFKGNDSRPSYGTSNSGANQSKPSLSSSTPAGFPGAPGTRNDPNKVPRTIGSYKEVYDQNSKKWYWWNERTHKSSWQLPFHLYKTLTEEASAKGDLPKGWSEQYDSSSKRVYYWNILTESASWTKPEKEDPSLDKSNLPPGWTEEFDEKTRRIFYWHEEKKESKWTFPKLEVNPNESDRNTKRQRI